MMDQYNKEMENNLLEMIRQKEHSDKRLLTMEIVLGVVCLLPLLAAVIFALVLPLEEPEAATLVAVSLVPLLVAMPFAIKIEQTAGYYQCAKCGHKHVPAYSSVFFAMHMGRTRYMRCPKCGQRSWQKKVLRKE